MESLVGRSAVVIGGGSGVGEGICHGLASAGMRVAVADLRGDAAAHVSASIRRESPRARSVAFEVDATDPASLESVMSATVEAFDRVDILVNTVGAILQRSLEDVSVAEWNWLWDMNVISHVNSVNVFLPELRERDEAHIVLTGAGAGFHAAPANAVIGPYSVAKHALAGYAKNLRKELANENIGVTLLCPTGIAGRLAEHSADSHAELVGGDLDIGGEQPPDRELVDGRILGPIVIDAIRNNDFIASNELDRLARRVTGDLEDLGLHASDERPPSLR